MKARDFWNKAADSYDKSVNGRYAEAYRRTIEITKKYLKSDDRLLDYGCGTGIVTNEIANSVQSIVAIDLSDRMIDCAKKKTSDNQIQNIIYLVGDLTNEQIKSWQYTVITAFNILYFIRDLDGFLRQIHDMLPSGGFFLSVTDCLGKTKGLREWISSVLMKIGVFPYMLFISEQELLAKIEKAGFEIIESENLFDDPPNVFVVATKR